MDSKNPIILCVDDEDVNLKLLEAILVPSGYKVVSATNGNDALLRISSQVIDLVLLDIMMPGMDGLEVCRKIKEDEKLMDIPIIMITGLASHEDRTRGIETGVDEYLTKPFHKNELLARIKMLLKVKKHNDDRKRTAINVTIRVMVSAVESRDPLTASHQMRSADLADAIAMEMGLSQDKIDAIRMAGSIHDIGKLSIPSEILSKPTKLSEIEFSLIKEHARQGYELLKNVESPWPLAEMIYQHHERMDGSGYPRYLKGDDIIMEARILAVSDVVESMSSHRPYRPALGIDAAMEEIEKKRGTLYDPVVAEACLRLFRNNGFRFAPSGIAEHLSLN
jgi:putative two-component system response regulator